MTTPQFAAVDVVIVNWNAGDQLRTCVDSLVRFGDDAVAKIVVVDNGSTDGSLTQIAHTPATVDSAGENLGFGRACNRGAAQGDSRYILFLNPDAAVHPGVLSEVVKRMDDIACEQVGIVGVKLVDERGHVARNCARFPTWTAMVGQSVGLSGKLPFFPAHFIFEFDHESDRNVDQVIGAFYFVRRTLFDSLEGFDERFFVYYEELDFAVRARRAGWQTRYFGTLASFHKGGGTSDRVKARRLFYLLRSRLLYALKHYRRMPAIMVVLATLCVEPLARLTRAFLRLSRVEASDTLRGTVMLWADLGATLRLARRASLSKY